MQASDSGHHPLSGAYPFLAVCNTAATIESVAGHDHDHGADRRMLAGALALIVGLLVAEIAVGILAGSLALLADAGHMLTDAAALALALVAAAVAQRPPGGSWTFGFRRVEILAALANGITLALVGIWIVYEAVRRLISPTDVRGGLVIALAVAGILVNLGAAALLLGPSRKSLNVRGAFLHVTTDLAAFAGTAVAGALILITGWNRFDPLASLAVAGLIFWSSAILLRESSRILLEISPGEMPPDEVAEAMLAVPDVVEVHDLHVWTVGSGFPALSAHVLVRPEGDCHEARRELAAMLAERFGLEHTTLQVEHARQQRPLGTELPLAHR
jgi:cobalt-zinc-cadmium efflux system protein